jgi:hypothetical protein
MRSETRVRREAHPTKQADRADGFVGAMDDQTL